MRWLRQNRLFVLLLLPSVLIICLVVVYPMGHALVSSLYKHSLARPYMGRQFVGAGNYWELLKSGRFWSGFLRTLAYTIAAVWTELVVGFAIAQLLARRIRGITVFKTIVAIPIFLAPVVVGYVWKFMLNVDFGFLNSIISAVGLQPISFLGSRSLVLVVITLVDVWQHTPFPLLLFLAALSTLPTAPFEAARIDGATAVQRIRYITLPLLRPVVLMALVIRSYDVFKTFDKIYVLTGGGPARASEVLTVMLYKTAFVEHNTGLATALSWVMLLLSMLIVSSYVRVLRSR